MNIDSKMAANKKATHGTRTANQETDKEAVKKFDYGDNGLKNLAAANLNFHNDACTTVTNAADVRGNLGGHLFS